MASQAQAIDLTGVGYDDAHSPSPLAAPACGNSHHTRDFDAMRSQLFACLKVNRDLREAAAGHAAELAGRDEIIHELRTRDEGRVSEIARLTAEKATLENKLSGRGKRQNRTWPEKLQALVVEGNRMSTYNTIHTLCCKEENMSTNPDFTHPLIRLTGSSNDWKLADGDVPQGQSDRTFPKFQALPSNIQARIFQLWLHKDRPVHCLSRLDPFRPPTAWPVANSTSGLVNRFYWGDERSLNMTEDTIDPQEALALLLVSKDFYFKGVHAFYGLNTFAFSSIGEFGRFAKGIGKGRAARIQHIDIIWTGSQYLTAAHTFSTNQKGKRVENWDSVRTRPLIRLLELPRLCTLAIFLAESNPRYERRKYESPEVKAKLLAATADQPNSRENRSLRTLQGADCLYLLRGLEWVKVYDLTKMARDVNPVPELLPIHDKSFLADINNSVTTPKSAKQAESSEFQALPPLFPPIGGGPQVAQLVNPASPMRPWNPNDQTLSTIQMFYQSSQRGGPHPNALSQTWYGVTLVAPAEDENGNVAAADGTGADPSIVGGPPTVVEGPANVAGEDVNSNLAAADTNVQPVSSTDNEGQAVAATGEGTANGGVEIAASTAPTAAKANNEGTPILNGDAAGTRDAANPTEVAGNVSGGKTPDSAEGYQATHVVTLEVAPSKLGAIGNKAAADAEMTDAVQEPSTGSHGDDSGPTGASSVRSAGRPHKSAYNESIFVDHDAMQPEYHNGRNNQRAVTRPSSQNLPTQSIQGTGRLALGPLSPAALNTKGSHTNVGHLTPNKRLSDGAGPANTKRRRQSVGSSDQEPATSGSFDDEPAVELVMTASSQAPSPLAGPCDAQLPPAQYAAAQPVVAGPGDAHPTTPGTAATQPIIPGPGATRPTAAAAGPGPAHSTPAASSQIAQHTPTQTPRPLRVAQLSGIGPRPPWRAKATPLLPLRRRSPGHQPRPDQPAPLTREEIIRRRLGRYVHCPSISSLLNPFADMLDEEDWAIVYYVLSRFTNARTDETFLRVKLRLAVDTPGKAASVGRILHALSRLG